MCACLRCRGMAGYNTVRACAQRAARPRAACLLPPAARLGHGLPRVERAVLQVRTPIQVSTCIRKPRPPSPDMCIDAQMGRGDALKHQMLPSM